MVTALSLDGYEGVHAVPGSVDGEEFLDFIVNIVVHCTFYHFCYAWTSRIMQID